MHRGKMQNKAKSKDMERSWTAKIRVTFAETDQTNNNHTIYMTKQNQCEENTGCAESTLEDGDVCLMRSPFSRATKFENITQGVELFRERHAVDLPTIRDQ
jgi:hypothetical protein